ncbi:hypothetical protein F5Y13DRAFT_102015 [Hypoxylon sp. FL1857]|nr:hypothetical protein F5Y13DRAFT_102015 [Hypoxylon sp. FL1857]
MVARIIRNDPWTVISFSCTVLIHITQLFLFGCFLKNPVTFNVLWAILPIAIFVLISTVLFSLCVTLESEVLAEVSKATCFLSGIYIEDVITIMPLLCALDITWTWGWVLSTFILQMGTVALGLFILFQKQLAFPWSGVAVYSHIIFLVLQLSVVVKVRAARSPRLMAPLLWAVLGLVMFVASSLYLFVAVAQDLPTFPPMFISIIVASTAGTMRSARAAWKLRVNELSHELMASSSTARLRP